MHCCIAVFTESDCMREVANALEPFDENLEVETEIYKTKQEIINETIEWSKEVLPTLCENFPTNSFYAEEKSFFDQEPTEEEVYKHYVEGEGSCAEFDEDGNELSTYNPNAQWDWYQIGGRWGGLLKLKDGSGSVDTAKVSDIDFEGSSDSEESDKERYKRFWEIVVEGSPLQEGEVKPTAYDASYFEKTYGTKENYIKANTQFSTFGYLTLEGDWIDQNNTENMTEYINGFEKYVAEHQDLYLTIVDIHI